MLSGKRHELCIPCENFLASAVPAPTSVLQSGGRFGSKTQRGLPDSWWQFPIERISLRVLLELFNTHPWLCSPIAGVEGGWGDSPSSA